MHVPVIAQEGLTVLQLLSEGLTEQDIASRCGMSVDEVHRRLAQACDLLHAPAPIAAVVTAVHQGLI